MEKMLRAVSVHNGKEEGSKTHHEPVADSNSENPEKENFTKAKNVREIIRLTNLDKYSCKGDTSSLLEEDKGNSFCDIMVSSKDYCTSQVTSMNQNQSPKKCECSLQTAENQHSTVAVSFVDYRNIDLSLPQEIGGIVKKEQNICVVACGSGELMPCSSDPTSSRWNIYGVDFKKKYLCCRN